MTRPGIEPRSPGPWANTQTIMPINGKEHIDITMITIQHLRMNQILALNNTRRVDMPSNK